MQDIEYAEEDDANEKFQKYLEEFQKIWSLTANSNCHYKLKEKKLIDFFTKLRKPIGINFSQSYIYH